MCHAEPYAKSAFTAPHLLASGFLKRNFMQGHGSNTGLRTQRWKRQHLQV